MTDYTLVDSRAAVRDDVGDIYRYREQVIPQSHMDRLKQEADDFRWRLDGLTKVASVPAALADAWLAEGFDIWNAPAKEIVKRLKAQSYESFVVSGSRSL